MKIDRHARLPIKAGEAIQPDLQTSPSTCGNQELASGSSLSPALLHGEAEVEVLATRANQLPEIAGEKVTSIQASLQEGTYLQVAPEWIADAILSEMDAWTAGRGSAAEESNKGAEFSSGPLTQYARQESPSKRRHRSAPLASVDDEFRKTSEPFRDEAAANSD